MIDLNPLVWLRYAEYKKLIFGNGHRKYESSEAIHP
jgi:hypothetical protein